MIIKASKIKNIDDFLDCALFQIPYVSVDSNFIIKEKEANFGSIISKVPCLSSKIIMEFTSINNIDYALTLCNPQILQFNCDINPSVILKYKSCYRVWKTLQDLSDVKKYDKYCDAFVVSYNNYQDLLNIIKSDKLIVIPTTQKQHIDEMKEIEKQNVIVEIDYYNNDIYDFSKNHSYELCE